MKLQTLQKLSDAVNCSAENGVEVDIVRDDRMIWVLIEKLRFQVAFGLDDLCDMGYMKKSRTLAIALTSGLSFVEIPCSIQQAKRIVSSAGWDIRQLHVANL
jgi:hypothetical protein